MDTKPYKEKPIDGIHLNSLDCCLYSKG